MFFPGGLPVIGTAELALFGTQAAIRLAQAARRSYVQDTAMRGLVIPLPQGLDDPLTHAQQHARAVRNVDRSRYDVEIAVDYFMHVPGALEADTKYSQTVLTFLQALEQADFQETDPDSLLVDIFNSTRRVVLLTANNIEVRADLVGGFNGPPGSTSREVMKAFYARVDNFEDTVKQSGLANEAKAALTQRLPVRGSSFRSPIP